MTDHPKNPFGLAVNPSSQETNPENIRDKDNVATELRPKYTLQPARPNLAPGGALGIKRDLSVPAHQQQKPSPRRESGDVSREFKSIAPPSPDKDRGHER